MKRILAVALLIKRYLSYKISVGYAVYLIICAYVGCVIGVMVNQ